MSQTAIVDAVERVMYEDKETVLAILEFQRVGISFGLSPDGLAYGGAVQPPGWEGHKWVRRDLLEWHERIETHFKRLVFAAGVVPTSERFYRYPDALAAN